MEKPLTGGRENRLDIDGSQPSVQRSPYDFTITYGGVIIRNPAISQESGGCDWEVLPNGRAPRSKDDAAI